MPTAFTHALVAASLGQAGKQDWRSDWRFWYAAILCSILPDIDLLGFRFGIHYVDLWGHRGMTHSLLFAAAIAAIFAFRFPLAWTERWKLMALLFFVTASHGLLDAMTNGGLGVAFFSPFDRERYFLPWTPMEVSPIGAGRFFSSRGLDVLWSEVVWVWGPALLLGGILYAFAHRRKKAISY